MVIFRHATQMGKRAVMNTLAASLRNCRDFVGEQHHVLAPCHALLRLKQQGVVQLSSMSTRAHVLQFVVKIAIKLDRLVV